MLELIIFLIFLGLLGYLSKYDYKNYQWVKEYLKKPFNLFKKEYKSYGPHENISYHLSENSLTYLTYYREYDQKSLENLNLDLRSKLKSSEGSQHFLNYLTVGIVPMFALSIALMSVYLNDIPLERKLAPLPLFLILTFAIIYILFRDLTYKTFITLPMQSHLFATEAVLNERK